MEQIINRETIEPFKECPSFISCSCNVCPLDPLSDEKKRFPGEEKCIAHKPTRYRIGSKHPNLLKYQGLTKREYLGKNMSQAERDRRRELFLSLGLNQQKTKKKGIVEGGKV